MAIETWLPALLGYLIPVGIFLLAWGGMAPSQARRATTLGALALALAALGYFAVGFAFHLGGAHLVAPDRPGLEGLVALFGREGDAEWGLIGLAGFFLAGDLYGNPLTSEALALFVTYLPLVATAVLLPVLSASGRAKGWQVAVSGLLVGAVLFPVVACWVWGGGWLSRLGSTLQRGHGFIDHSGASVVYLLGGAGALGALVGLGQRLPPSRNGEPVSMPPAHFPLLANLGALLFGLGWLGWSLSRPFHVAGAQLSLEAIAVNGLLAGAGAILTSQAYSWFTVGHADPLMSARGAAAGFIAISAGAPFVPPWAALVIGAVGGGLLPLGVYVVERVLRFPDETAAVALGIVPGLWGSLAVAVFADGRWGQGWNGIGVDEYHTVVGQGVTGFISAFGFQGDGPGQMIAQLAGIGVVAVLAFVVGWIGLLLLNLPYRPRRVRAPETGQPQAPPELEEASGEESDPREEIDDSRELATMELLLADEPGTMPAPVDAGRAADAAVRSTPDDPGEAEGPKEDSP